MDPATRLPDTERVDPRYQDLDIWPAGAVLAALWEAQMAAVASVAAALPAIEAAAVAAAGVLSGAGRLVYVGAGTSGRIAIQDGAELLPTFGWPSERLLLLMAGGASAFVSAAEGAEDDGEAAAREVREARVAAGDVVLGIAASGGTRFTSAALAEAGRRGALTIGVANVAQGRLLSDVAHPIAVPTGAEPLAGSTRLKAGTAQKVVLNLFSTLVMIRLGRVYRGRMVDMRVSNDKLRERAIGMVAALAGVGTAQAIGALEQAGWRIKPAVLVARGLSPAAAEQTLAANGGRLRGADQTGSVSSA